MFTPPPLLKKFAMSVLGMVGRVITLFGQYSHAHWHIAPPPSHVHRTKKFCKFSPINPSYKRPLHLFPRNVCNENICKKKSPSAGFSSPSPCMSEVQRVRLSRSSCKVRALNVIGRPPPISVGQKVLDRFNFSSRLWTFFLPLLSSKLTVHVTQKQQCGSSWGKAPAWSECCPCKTPPTMCPAPQSRRQMLPEIFQSFRQLLNGEKMQCLKMS